jgi:hypothetical protein
MEGVIKMSKKLIINLCLVVLVILMGSFKYVGEYILINHLGYMILLAGCLVALLYQIVNGNNDNIMLSLLVLILAIVPLVSVPYVLSQDNNIPGSGQEIFSNLQLGYFFNVIFVVLTTLNILNILNNSTPNKDVKDKEKPMKSKASNRI